jgi:hypothetical protein
MGKKYTKQRVKPADTSIYGTYVAPMVSAVTDQITNFAGRRGVKTTGKNNTYRGRYSS